MHASDKELKAATEVLEMGERFAEQCGSHYMKWEYNIVVYLTFVLCNSYVSNSKTVSKATLFDVMNDCLIHDWGI